MPGDAESGARRVGRWLLAAFFALAGIGHFMFADAMVRVTPDWVPMARAVVIATGLAELAGAAGLMTRRWRVAAGWAFAAYAVCVFPANVKHAMLDLGSGTGLSLWYHGPRLLAQPLVVWWALWASGAVRWRGARG